MKVSLRPGRYVVAVSGGVDSMVLLRLLSEQPGLELIVAHYDHGIRQDSAKDRQFVAAAAETLGLPFLYAEGNLGASTSEELARQKRYEFLQATRQDTAAVAIVTAHHQDDVLETMCINLLRGTHRRGLSSLKSSDNLLRPLLPYSKNEIQDYARQHGIKWVEDVSNTDQSYLRNYVRHSILPKLTDTQRASLLEIHANIQRLNNEIEDEIAKLLQGNDRTLSRQWFVLLPHAVGCEVVAGMFRTLNVPLSRELIERTVVAVKVLPLHKRFVLNKTTELVSKKDRVIITSRKAGNP